MYFKMKDYFVICLFLVFLFSKDCDACFKENTVSSRIIKTRNGFYEDCCCTEEGYNNDDLQWLDPENNVIGPAGTASNVHIDKHEEDGNQSNCLSLVTANASKTASGTYRCITNYKGVSHSQIHHIDVYDPLFFIKKLPSQYLLDGTDSRVYCKARGAAEPVYRWYRGKDGQEEIHGDSVKYQFVDDGVIVKNVTNNDAGIYKCTASVPSTGEEDELDIDVQIMTVPVIQEIEASPEATVKEEESLIVQCKAKGFPNPTYKWQKLSNSKGVDDKKNGTWEQDNNTLRFKSIKSSDAGIYECIASNFAGNTSKTIEIKVLLPPKIALFPSKTAVEGAEVSVQCLAYGNPIPNITITYEGKSFKEEKNETYDAIDNFSLIKVNRSREGTYVCHANNDVGFATAEMQLTVLHKPYFDTEEEKVWGWNGENIELNCAHEANPPSDVIWRYEKNADAIADEVKVNEELKSTKVKSTLKYTFNVTENFAPYGHYKCFPRNYLGEGYKHTDFQKGFVPSFVENNTLINVTATSATFDVETPLLDKGPEVLGIKAEYDTAENINITDIHINRTWAIGRPFKLEKLKPKSTYYIRFAAINRVGTGPWGTELSFDTLDKSAPEPPIWEVDSPQLPPNNVLKWKVPEDNGEPIDYYALRYCPILDEFDESLCKEQRVVGATEQELNDLQYNTTYYFELTAHNAEGSSAVSNITLSVSASELPVAQPLLSGGAIIGISIVLVFLCLILLDLLFLFWRQKGLIASCCYKNSNKKKPNPLNSRDKKGLLKDNGERTDDSLRRPNNGHKEYEYNKTTGIITGKHSSV